MAMTPREVMRRAIRFENPDRMPYTLPPEFGSDHAECNMTPSPDWRPGECLNE